MTDATELDEAAIRARVEDATELWAWHESTDDTNAGWGAHMGQMLYRLPVDGQTRDIKKSILWMLADLSAALDEITRLRAALDEARAEVERLRAHLDLAGDTEESLQAANDRLRTNAASDGQFRTQVIELLLDALGVTDDLSPEQVAERLDGCRCEASEGTRHLIWHLAQKVARAEAAESSLAAIRTLARSWSGRHDLLMTGDSAAHDIEAALAATTTERTD